MIKVYKSSKIKVLFCWIVFLILTGFLLTMAAGGLMMLLDTHRDTFFGLLPFVACLSIIVASYLAFFYWNIKVEVDTKEVRFLRGKRVYLRFNFSENILTFSVNTNINQFGRTTDRFLRVFPRGAKYGKDYKLHNFSRSTFEECMTYITSLNFNQVLQQEVIVDDFENEVSHTMSKRSLIKMLIEELETHPHEFTLNKQVFVKKKRNDFLAMAIPMGVFSLVLIIGVVVMPIITQNQFIIDNLMSTIGYVFFLLALFVTLTVTLGWIPHRKAKNNTPEKITVYHDRIVFDNREFKFCNITQIKMTTPNTIGGKVTNRIIQITENHLTKTYSLGDDSDRLSLNIRRKKKVKVFEHYVELFGTLQNIFAIRAGENEVSIFNSIAG
jgi:hypothetical protein